MKRDLSPEARGVLVALTSLGRIRHLDRTSRELAEAGLAEIRSGTLTINPEGRAIGKEISRRPKMLAKIWGIRAEHAQRH